MPLGSEFYVRHFIPHFLTNMRMSVSRIVIAWLTGTAYAAVNNKIGALLLKGTDFSFFIERTQVDTLILDFFLLKLPLQ